jgi:hypothetical protein
MAPGSCSIWPATSARPRRTGPWLLGDAPDGRHGHETWPTSGAIPPPEAVRPGPSTRATWSLMRRAGPLGPTCSPRTGISTEDGRPRDAAIVRLSGRSPAGQGRSFSAACCMPTTATSRMGRGQELHAWADLDVVADGDGGHVQQDHPEVDEGPRPDMGLVAVVAVQGRADLGPLPDRAQRLPQQGQPRLGVGGIAGVASCWSCSAAWPCGGSPGKWPLAAGHQQDRPPTESRQAPDRTPSPHPDQPRRAVRGRSGRCDAAKARPPSTSSMDLTYRQGDQSSAGNLGLMGQRWPLAGRSRRRSRCRPPSPRRADPSRPPGPGQPSRRPRPPGA